VELIRQFFPIMKGPRITLPVSTTLPLPMATKKVRHVLVLLKRAAVSRLVTGQNMRIDFGAKIRLNHEEFMDDLDFSQVFPAGGRQLIKIPVTFVSC